MQRQLETILDEWLVLRAQAGESEALSELVGRWQPRLARHAFQLTGRVDVSADVVQETWLAVAQDIGGLRDPACFPRWVLQILSRRCANWVRSRQRQRRLVEEIAVQSKQEPCPGEDAAARDEHQRLRAALRRLPNDRRALLSMSYLDGLSIAEMAEILDIPPGTVKSRLHHARHELKTLLERKEP